MIARMVRSVGLEPETFTCVKEFLAGWEPSQPGCLVLDVRMPGESGLDLQEQLVRSGASLPIVFISGHGNVPMSVRAMKHGAVDFLEKPFDDQALLDAIHAALARDAERRASERLRADARARVARLTPREREVLALVVAGGANKQIAAQLGTTEQTIKMHRGRVMAKMSAGSVAELVMLAQLAGVIAPPA
ncbi:MAG TPA: response regulator [Phycisphaerae bacterium]|nr:response regulator [Phycisphaerae bacterium]HOJ72926.1 response regulator [Phycisphaerae bacterium]HOM50110.1 response regulator [Phycisphaerae bacterium]HON68920.1 response regulator [Phycisphaerae bacterium]HOQ86648.1 response regulator [Phycisphaerae bacterium]